MASTTATVFPEFAPQSYRVVDCLPLGTVIAGWKPHSAGVGTWRDSPHFVLVLTVAGHADFADRAGRSARLGPGDCLVLVPGLAHRFVPVSGEPWDEFYLICSGPAFAPWFGGALFSSERPVLHLGAAEYWLRRFAAVAPADEDAPALAAAARLMQLFADILSAVGAGRAREDLDWLARARALLVDPGRALPLAAIARRLGLGERRFRQRFQALAGMAPVAFREQARLERACKLLRGRSVAAVAEELGYCDAFHFSRRFRQRYGVPPKVFREVVAW